MVLFCLWVAHHSVAPVQELLGPSPWIRSYSPYYWLNSYGVFGFVNLRRFQPALQYRLASSPAWRPLHFRWACLPGDPQRAPCLIAPLLHSRLQWTTWIYTTASLEHDPQRHRRFVPGFLVQALRRLKKADPVITPLFEPLDGQPVAIRAALFEYFFPNISEHWRTGAWYRRKQLTEWIDIR